MSWITLPAALGFQKLKKKKKEKKKKKRKEDKMTGKVSKML